MSDQYRVERVKRLLKELEHEITRGMMEGELESETLTVEFFVPTSKTSGMDMIQCLFKTRPIPRYYARMDAMEPRLKLVDAPTQLQGTE